MNTTIENYIKLQQSGQVERRPKFKGHEVQAAWIAVGQNMVKSVNPNREYDFDTNAERIMKVCFGDTIKGAIFWGSKGLGKTLNLDIFAKINRELYKIHTECYEAEEIEFGYKAYGADYILKLSDLPCLVINDIGRESDVLKDYGTNRNIMADLLAIRYRRFQTKGFRTFGTMNAKIIKDVKELYSHRIEDRYNEMFNFIELKGESKR